MIFLRRTLLLMALLPALLAAVGCSSAHLKHATKDQAQTMATKAADAVKNDGDKAFTAFNNSGEWRDGDLYVFVIDRTGTWKASGARPELVGKNDLHIADSDGKLYVKEIIAVDKEGWVDYKFKSPADNQEHDKSSYIIRVGDFLVGSGAYWY
jgi:cytochrome c